MSGLSARFGHLGANSTSKTAPYTPVMEAKKPKMARRLKTAEDVRRFLAHIIRKLENNKIDPTVAGRLGYLANILVRCIEGSDLEQRLAALEQQLGEDDA